MYLRWSVIFSKTGRGSNFHTVSDNHLQEVQERIIVIIK